MPAGIIDLPSLLRVRELVRAAQPEYVLTEQRLEELLAARKIKGPFTSDHELLGQVSERRMGKLGLYGGPRRYGLTSREGPEKMQALFRSGRRERKMDRLR